MKFAALWKITFSTESVGKCHRHVFCSSIWEPNGWGWEGRVSSSLLRFNPLLLLILHWEIHSPKGLFHLKIFVLLRFLAPLPHWTYIKKWPPPLRFSHPLLRFWGYPHLHPHRLNSQMEQSPGFIYCKDVPGRTGHYWNNVNINCFLN